MQFRGGGIIPFRLLDMLGWKKDTCAKEGARDPLEGVLVELTQAK